MQRKPLDLEARVHVGQERREVHIVVPAVHAVAVHILVVVRLRGRVARQQIPARATVDHVIPVPARDEVGAAIAEDQVRIRPAEEPVVARATVDLERGQNAALLEVADLEAPLFVAIREEELGIAAEHVIAGAQVHHHVLDLARLVVEVKLREDSLVRPNLAAREAQGGAARRERDVRGGVQDLRLRKLGRQEHEPALVRADDNAVGEIFHEAGHDVRRRPHRHFDVLGQVADRSIVRVRRHQDAEFHPTQREAERDGRSQLAVHGRAVLANQRVTRQRLRLKQLVRRVPGERRELVTMQDAVVAHGGKIRDGTTQIIEIATDEQHAVHAVTAEHLVHRGRDVGLVRIIFQRRQEIRDDLEGVITRPAEEQVAGLPVEAARNHVVAGAAEDPVLARAALEPVVARAAEDDILAHRVDRGGVADRLGHAGLEDEVQAVDRRNEVRRIDLEQIRSARREAGERDGAAGLAREIQDGVAALAGVREELVAGGAVRLEARRRELRRLRVDRRDDLVRRALAVPDAEGERVRARAEARRLGARDRSVEYPHDDSGVRDARADGEAVVRAGRIDHRPRRGGRRIRRQRDGRGQFVDLELARALVRAGLHARVISALRQTLEQQRGRG